MFHKLIFISIFVTYIIGKNILINGDDNVEIISGNLYGNDKIATTIDTRNGNSVYFTAKLPKNFDARKKWLNCPSIGHIYNQGNCLSSYAISVASAVSDRICIHSNGTKNPIISSQQIISCCFLCGNGCNGGKHSESWDFYRRHGFVSGGDYESNQGCQPYTVQPCKVVTKNSTEGTCTFHDREITPKCDTKCYNPTYHTSYRNDIYKGKYYKVYPYMAMKEIYENGPITTQFYMYEDLVSYKTGVYQYNEQSDVNMFVTQSVKIIGWGEQDGLSYWLVANSFGPDWGDRGTFKIARGEDGCYFQENMYAGLPL